MRAIWQDTVVAESDDTVVVEGNHYFPAESLVAAHFAPAEAQTVCPWKGTASYYDVVVDGQTNPVFARQIAAPLWAWPVLMATSLLSGLLLATYVREPARGLAAEDPLEDGPGRRGAAAGLLSFFAVGCPVCNKIVVLALGYTGALRWFEPVQPYLAVLAVALLGWALRGRLRGELACGRVGA